MSSIDTHVEQARRDGGTHERAMPGSESTVPGSAAVAAMVTHDFEHRRVYAAVKRQLFGQGQLQSIGHFRATRRLGAGGMGEVYLCDDDKLGRQVAVKRVLGDGSEGDHERLRHEARALARLSHPNVVQVYEVGEHEGRAFVAMEYIAGQTLGDWLERERPWREVLELFLAAGRGLAAAHEVGLVHRDFKPDNVLIGEDGSVHVADFGLAFDRDYEGLTTEDDALTGPRAGSSRVGVAMGTVPYMSLEQLRGETLDARSDQFSFCVALYEGLWGEQPYPGQTIRHRLAALEAEQLQRPRGHRALFRVLQRGLRRDRSRRWSDMGALLDALEAVSRRRRLGVVVGGAMVGLGALLGLLIGLRGPAVCDASLDGVWDARAREGLERHISSLDAGHVEDSGQRVLAALDGWAGAWAIEREATCELLEVPPDPLALAQIDARHQCLTRVARRFSSLVDGVRAGDADTLGEAVLAVTQLPDPAACADALALRGLAPPPAAVSQVVDVLRARLDETRELRLLGRIDDALALALASESAALRLGYAPLIAEARAQLAMVEDTRGSSVRAAVLYDAAIRLAESERLDGLVAELLIERTELTLYDLREYETVTVRLERAEAACERVGLTPLTRARLAFIRGRLAERSDDHPQARVRYEQALALAGEGALERAEYLDALAGVSEDQDRALDLRRLALEVSRERFGPRHPRTAKHLYNYGSALQDAGRGGDEYKRLAARIWDGSGSRWQAKSEQQLAAQAIQRGDFDLAEEHALEMGRILDEFLVTDHPAHGEPEQLLATIEALRADLLGPEHAPERRGRAILHGRAALHHFEAEGDGQDPRIASLYLLIGNQMLSLERFDEADAELTRVLDSTKRPRDMAMAELRRADIAFRRADLDQADHHLRKAAKHIEAAPAERPGYELLRALVDLRLGRLTLAQVRELDLVKSEYRSMDQAFAVWLVDLRASETERAALGFGSGPAAD